MKPMPLPLGMMPLPPPPWANGCFTPGSGPGGLSSEERLLVKHTAADQPADRPKKNEFNLLLEYMKQKPTESEPLQQAVARGLGDQKYIKSGLSRMLSAADVDKMMEEAQEEYNASSENRMKENVTKRNKAPNNLSETKNKFKKLPEEIRIIIWGEAIPKLFEAIPDPQKSRFMTAGPRNAVLSLLHDYPKVFFMKPLLLVRQNHPVAGRVPIETIWIRPAEDILYLNTEALYALDIPAFTSIPGNQVIENIALPVAPMERIRWCGTTLGREPGTRTWLGDLVRGLKNLKKIYVIEGHTLHNESEIEYFDRDDEINKFSLSLEELKTAKQTKEWTPPSQSYSPPAKPWNQDYKAVVEKAFADEVEREMSGKHEIIFQGEWNVPEIVCMELKRTTWREAARPQHWQRQNPFAF